MGPDRTTLVIGTRRIEVFSIKGFADNKIAPENNENKHESVGKVGSMLPYVPFSSNSQKANFDYGIKQEKAWNNYKEIDKSIY